MNNNPTPPLPESDKHGSTLGIVAACCGAITVLAAAAAVFLLLQSKAIVSLQGLVAGGISALLGLISLFLGIVAMLSIQSGNRAPAFVGMISGCLGLILVIPVMGTVSYRVAQQKLLGPEMPPVAPLVIRETARTEKDNDQLWHQWFEENLDQPMKSRLAGKPWEKEGLEVIKAFPNTWLSKVDKLGELEWQRLAASLFKKKCDDPTLLHLVSRSSDVGVRKLAYLINSSKGIGTSELSPLWAFITEMDKAEMTEYSKKDEERLPTDAEAIRRLKRSCEAGCFEGEKIWLLGKLLTESSGAKFSDRKGGEIADVFEKTGMPEWTVHWMRGEQEIKIAWDFRGSGYSSKVTEEGWKGFREHLKLARAELTKSWELAPEYPFAAASMITVCRGDSNDHLEEMRLWLDRAMAAQTDNWHALNLYKTGLYPKWHGSHEMMLEFAERCLETERFDTWVPWMYLDVSKYLASRSPDKIAYYADEKVYANLMALMDGYLEKAKTEAEKQRYLTYQMVFSSRAGHSDMLPDIWEKLKGKPDHVVLGNWQLDREDLELSMLLDRENIHTSDIEELVEQGFYDDAAFTYKAISDQENLTEAEQLALQRQISLIDLRKNWDADEWVTLWPTKTPELWRIIEGDRLPDAGGTLKFRSDTFRYVFEHALVLGKEYEIEMEMGPLQDTRGTSGGGVWIGKRPWSDTRWNSMTLREINKNQYSINAAHWRYKPAWGAKIPKKKSVLLHLECRGKDWTVSVDGKVQNAEKIKMRLYDSGRDVRLVLGGYVQPEHKTIITYKSIRVRKLESPEE